MTDDWGVSHGKTGFLDDIYIDILLHLQSCSLLLRQLRATCRAAQNAGKWRFSKSLFHRKSGLEDRDWRNMLKKGHCGSTRKGDSDLICTLDLIAIVALDGLFPHDSGSPFPHTPLPRIQRRAAWPVGAVYRKRRFLGRRTFPILAQIKGGRR